MVDEERLSVIFANTDAIEKYIGGLLQLITMAGVDGTFKTVPKNPTDLRELPTYFPYSVQKCGKLGFFCK